MTNSVHNTPSRVCRLMAALLLALLAPLCPAGNDGTRASEPSTTQTVPFVEWDKTAGTLTFKYGYKPTDDPATSSDREYFDVDAPYDVSPAWTSAFAGQDAVKKVIFDESFKDFRPTTCRGWFSGGFYLQSIEGMENLNTSNVTDMGLTFYGCNVLASLDVSKFNTSNVTNMGLMFYGCNVLASLDVSKFNTSNVTNMGLMFYGCSNLSTIIYVGDAFTTDEVNNVGYMFYGCQKLVVAVKYQGDDSRYANYEDGYFTKKVGTNGGEIIGAVGNPLTIAELHLDDNKAFVLYEDCHVANASYVRQMRSEWGTLCLPFTIEAVPENAPCSFYTLQEVDEESVMLERVESGQIAAGQPVIIRRTDGRVTEANLTNALDARVVAHPTDAEGGNRLVGTFATAELADGCYFLANDEFRLVGDYKPVAAGVKLAAFRASLQPQEQAARRAPVLNIGVDNGATAIDAQEVTGALNDARAEYYDLDAASLPCARHEHCQDRG